MTLEAQYNRFLKDNPGTTFSFNEWKVWHGNQVKQALTQMMQDDEELVLYDYDLYKDLKSILKDLIMINPQLVIQILGVRDWLKRKTFT